MANGLATASRVPSNRPPVEVEGAGHIASDLLRTELLRATRRAAPDRMQRARTVLDALTLINLTSATFERAATLDPDELRSQDAPHLAAALELGDELDGIVTYDSRMAAAASLYGVAVIAPA